MRSCVFVIQPVGFVGQLPRLPLGWTLALRFLRVVAAQVEELSLLLRVWHKAPLMLVGFAVLPLHPFNINDETYLSAGYQAGKRGQNRSPRPGFPPLSLAPGR